jgi:hypothetical protein
MTFGKDGRRPSFDLARVERAAECTIILGTNIRNEVADERSASQSQRTLHFSRCFVVVLRLSLPLGYCAFSIPIDVVCAYLGAADASTRQLLLAFESGRKRISNTVKQVEIPATGDRVVLDRRDL